MNTPQRESTSEEALWYKDAIIYELHIKAFMDSNGDGIGDFKGLMQKLDYLQELGVTAIWLLPFYPSPLRDDGYDIADYYQVNSRYGSLKDIKLFVKEAHKRNLKVITELVVNHTSDQHPWFQRARQKNAPKKYRDFYVWSDDPNKYSDTRIIFTDTEPSNWTWDPEAEQYYWHRFFSHQPDLNYDNPQVQKEVIKVLEYWLDMGVDGFRLDAVPYLFEREGTNCENLPETHVFLKKLRAHLDSKYQNKLLLAEANMWPEDSAAYFGEGDECHMNYHFPIMPRMFMALKMEDRYPITDILEQTPEIPNNCQWAMFLRNHDELTLEMVTDEERDYMYRMYTKDPKAKINVGIRHRLAPLLENDRRRIELMNVLLMSMPGTPVLYYGDEIGMGDNFHLGDRDGVRTPMQWNQDRNGGFSKANPQQLYLPTIQDPEYHYAAVNVEVQEANTNSLLWWTRRLIAMRKKFKVFGRGNIEFLHPENSRVLAFTRNYEDEHLLVVVNLSRFTQPVSLDLAEYEDYQPIEVFSKNKFPKIGSESYPFTLSPYSYHWLELKPSASKQEEDKGAAQRKLKINSLESLQREETQATLVEKILVPYIQHIRWFGGKARTQTSVQLAGLEQIKIKNKTAYWYLLRFTYNEGLPELYQLPLIIKPEDSAEDIIGTLQTKTGNYSLLDAVCDADFREYLVRQLAKKAFKEDENIRAKGNAIAVQQWLKAHPEVPSRVLKAEQSNTSLIYGNQFFFKLYRKLDYTLNPDAEVSQFLSEKAKFTYTPSFVAGLVWEQSAGKKLTVGMLQNLVPNLGDAWELFRKELRQFFEQISTTHAQAPREVSFTNLAAYTYGDIPAELDQLPWQAWHYQVDTLGKRTAQMHQALASQPKNTDFSHEDFSLHYQRSVYSSLQGLTRTSFDLLRKQNKKLEGTAAELGSELLGRKKEVLEAFKQIFDHKIDTLKIRTHGDYHLGQVLNTGKDFLIIDFEGEPARAFSERRIRRSPLRDVAGMLRSFHYAAYNAVYSDNLQEGERAEEYLAWADWWYHHFSAVFLSAYKEELGEGSALIPKSEADTELLLTVFLLEKAIYELTYELNNRPDWSAIPLTAIKQILDEHRTND
jgi:maltose alpha-D-glucosyltransferase/alpha-amylase